MTSFNSAAARRQGSAAAASTCRMASGTRRSSSSRPAPDGCPLLDAALRPSASAPAAAAAEPSKATPASWVVYVLVAATACSGVSHRLNTCSAVRPSGEPGSLVKATVGRPCCRPSSTTWTTSGDWPDWEMPTTSAPVIRGGVPYKVCSEGAAGATGRPASAPQT